MVDTDMRDNDAGKSSPEEKRIRKRTKKLGS